MRFYKLGPADIIVIHDELDLAPGKLKLKTGGGHGGHNGLKSIDAPIAARTYKRLRIGIGHPGHKDRVNPHVLGDFAKSDRRMAGADARRHRRSCGVDRQRRRRGLSQQDRAGPPGAADPKPARTEKPGPADGGKPAPAGKSHIRQARNSAQPKTLPTSGPMADMLKRLFGDKNT